MLILVDSGSSHSFINDAIAAKLSAKPHAITPSRVRIADGGFLHCSQQLSRCAWWVQGHFFQTDLRLLPLGAYDVVLGMDWLAEFSPM